MVNQDGCIEPGLIKSRDHLHLLHLLTFTRTFESEIYGYKS